MGRKKTRTAESIREDNRKRAKLYYSRHRALICENRMGRYWGSKEKNKTLPKV